MIFFRLIFIGSFEAYRGFFLCVPSLLNHLLSGQWFGGLFQHELWYRGRGQHFFCDAWGQNILARLACSIWLSHLFVLGNDTTLSQDEHGAQSSYRK